MSGKVYIVGAGPGDPGLLTLRARELLDRVDLILYDQLVDERIRLLFPDSCEAIFVGKEGGKHHVTQDQTMKMILTQMEKANEVKADQANSTLDLMKETWVAASAATAGKMKGRQLRMLPAIPS